MSVVFRSEEIELENEQGQEIPSVRVTCLRCEHRTEAFGTSEASLRRCAVLLRIECPRKERNFYIVEI